MYSVFTICRVVAMKTTIISTIATRAKTLMEVVGRPPAEPSPIVTKKEQERLAQAADILNHVLALANMKDVEMNPLTEPAIRQLKDAVLSLKGKKPTVIPHAPQEKSMAQAAEISAHASALAAMGKAPLGDENTQKAIKWLEGIIDKWGDEAEKESPVKRLFRFKRTS